MHPIQSVKPNAEPRFVSRLTRETLALVMAGGRGTRLRNLTQDRAKPAVPFGGKFRIIDFTLSNCINSGIRRIGVLTQYKSHALIRHLERGWSFLRGQFGEFIELLPAEQNSDRSSWYVGTADAVYQNIEFIRRHQPSYVLVLAGDHVYNMDYGPMLAHHVASGADITIGSIEVPISEAVEFGIMSVDENTRVHDFIEKSPHPKPMPGRPDTALASMGIYVFDARFLLYVLQRDAGMRNSGHDFGHDVIPDAIRAGRVYAFPFRDIFEPEKQGYWRDVGTVDAYWRANIELCGAGPVLDLDDERWPVWTGEEQSAPARFASVPGGPKGAVVDALCCGGCVVTGAEIERSVLFTNARVGAGSRIEETLLLPNVTVGRDCRLRRAVIDEGCTVPDGLVIGEDPDTDQRLFHRSGEGVTLVTQEMLDNLHALRRSATAAAAGLPALLTRPLPASRELPVAALAAGPAFVPRAQAGLGAAVPALPAGRSNERRPHAALN